MRKLTELTPDKLRCGVGPCPAVFEDTDTGKSYLVIGKKIDPKEVGLEDRVADDEMLVEVPKGILSQL